MQSSGGELKITKEGNFKKFLSELDQVSYNGQYAMELGQKVLIVTERAVFEKRPEGLVLTEIAPGIDLDQDIIQQMEFEPIIATEMRIMDLRLFKPEKMNIQAEIQQKPQLNLPIRLRKKNDDE